MSSMLETITPKSNQLNADDLIGGITKTIKITGVKIASGDQPVSLSFEGDAGKPFLPCKSMRRVLVHCWGKEANAYVGRRLTLYRDPTVRFGGTEVGGIRISHMSDIAEPITMALTATRAQRKPFTVKPLDPSPAVKSTEEIDQLIKSAYGTTTSEEIEAIAAKATAMLKGKQQSAKSAELREVIAKKREEFKANERQPGED